MKYLAIPVAAAFAMSPVFANDAHHPAAPPAASIRVESSDTVAAQVRRIDAGAGKVTLSHGPLKNLGMPGMTMGFPVVDPGQLEGLSAGDRVTATIAKRDGDYVVTRLEPSK